MNEKGHAIVLLSKEELEVLEACVLICLGQNLLDADTAKDARDVLEEIRLCLGKNKEAVADAIGEEVRAEYGRADR